MKPLSQTLCLCLALVLSLTAMDRHHAHAHDHHDHAHHHHAHDHHEGEPEQNVKQHCHEGHCHDHNIDRCEGIEMDAVAVNEEGIPYFFHDHHLFKGFHEKVEHFNETFSELNNYLRLGHVDAAFRMHNEDNAADHDHMFLFLDHKVFSYYQHTLEEGYPKNISEVFPGIPDHLDAAVECPKSECGEDSVIFFKAGDIYHYDVTTKAVDKKVFEGFPICTSALRFMEHYYCFHGHMFCKFDPKTGEVQGIAKAARDYFMRCSKFGENADHVERERCSRVHLDAITSDKDGNLYAFRGHHYLHKDIGNETLTADTVENDFKELHSEVDAVLSYEDHLYMVKDEQVFVYKVGEPHTHLQGYPKPLSEELGIEGPIDAAFICHSSSDTAHIIKGQKIYDVDMKASPRAAGNERPFALFKKVDAALCGPDGVKVVVGSHFYTFESVMLMVTSRALPEQHKVSFELFGCDH